MYIFTGSIIIAKSVKPDSSITAYLHSLTV